MDGVIHREIAQRFVDRLCERLPYNVNIMDTAGTIIAARDPERRGTFHEGAYRICNEAVPEIVIHVDTPRPRGTLPGVNLPVTHDGRIIGAVGITGDPSEVSILSQAVKTAIETMVEHELYKERLASRQDKKKALLSLLLDGDQEDQEKAGELARQLGYEPGRPCAALLLPVQGGVSHGSLLRALKRSSEHTRQDFSSSLPDGTVVVFKTASLPTEEKVSALRAQLESYVEAVRQACREDGLSEVPPVYCGSLALGMAEYPKSVSRAEWLVRHIEPSRFSRTCFFYDYLYEYLIHLLPHEELTGALGPFVRDLEPRTFRALRQTLIRFVENSASIKGTAEALGLHRNTVLQRLNRLHQVLGMDPIHSEYARSVLFAFFHRFGE